VTGTNDKAGDKAELAPLLDRLASALERIAPPPRAEVAPFSAEVLRWTGRQLEASLAGPPLPLSLYRGVESQRAALEANLRALAHGGPAHDMLLWGARGMGKSALVRSVAAEQRLPLVEVAGTDLASLGQLFALLGPAERPALIFVDDLGFDGDGAAVRMMRSLLDGGARSRPDRLRLVVTSNHRHLVARAEADAQARHARDHEEDQLALVDRFGLVLGFHLPDQPTYLAMCRAYLEAEGLELDEADAVAFALARGTRSGRTAWHYRVERLVRARR
jgi:predicted AAA+ superfamily ATPase